MKREDAIWILELIRNRDARTDAEKDAVNSAIEALKAQLSCEGTTEGTTSDLIDRQAALDIFDDYNVSVENGELEAYSRDRKRMCELPPAQPERKRGEWVYNSPVTMKCNRCGLVIKDWDWHRFKICPNCGADMRGGENDGCSQVFEREESDV